MSYKLKFKYLLNERGVFLHEGHRKRMRERFKDSGFDSFQKHEILEMLLYFTNSRKDTNEIAHVLIKHFGSFSAVFDAPFEELIKVKGIGESTAHLIKLVPAISSVYLKDKLGKKIKIKDDSSAFKFLYTKYLDKTIEMPSALFLSNAGDLLGWDVIGSGSVGSAEIFTRKIVELSIRYNASNVILCHNHPSGVALPSLNDYTTTKSINDALKIIDVKLIDHIVIGNDDYVSMQKSKEFKGAFV